ncbi:MAG: hypothetical protein M1401_03365 [Chloroflexi bacterium]|nr:hypothetical protein [Chloroflexota bacterium]MCL5107906.1 hypothetical protein [Chloroflexota bacterium]
MLHPPAPKTTEERIVEIYACLQIIKGQLAAIETKLDNICDNCEVEENRLKALEEWRTSVRGGLKVLGVIAGAAGVVGGLVVKVFNP